MARLAMRLCAIAVLLLTLGCQGILLSAGASGGKATATAMDLSPAIVGQVQWPGSPGPGAGTRQVQACIGCGGQNDIANASTISLIDTSTDTTVGTSWTDSSGNFSLSVPGFLPASGSVYILEAVKGLFDNAVNHNAARIRTFIEYIGNQQWENISATTQIYLTPCSTALSIIWGIGQAGGPVTSPAPDFMGTDFGCNAPAPYGYSEVGTNGSDGVATSSFETVYGLVNTAIQENTDPVANIGVNNANNYTLFLAPIPLIYQLIPNEGAVGAQIEAVGQHFLQPVASTSINFDFDTTDELCDNLNGFTCVSEPANSVSSDGTTAYFTVPSGALSGPVTITTVDGNSNAVNFQVIPGIGVPLGTAQASVN